MYIKSTLIKFFIGALLFSASATISAQVFWEENFDNNIPDTWDLVDNTGANGDLWMETTVGPTGGTPTEPLHASNTGEIWAIYDSDLDCSGNQDAWMITDVIDCSGQDDVWLEFDQFYRNFFCETYIRVSTDINAPLNSWAEIQINILDEIANEFGDDHIFVNLTPYAAQNATVFIAFEFRNLSNQAPPGQGGCAYNWQVDNIQLTNIDPTPQNDMVISNEFFAVAPWAIVPQSQVETFGFLADVANIGQATQTGVALEVNIQNDGTNTIVHTESLGYGTMMPGDTIENQLFPDDGFTPPAEVAGYTGQYNIITDSMDANPSNNRVTFNFLVSEDVFAKETEATISIFPAESEWGATEPWSWAYGNHYYTPNGNGWFANEVTFALGNPSMVTGKTITIVLYEWTTINIDPSTNQDPSGTIVTPDQRSRVGINSYTITGSELQGELITVDLLDINSGDKGVALKDGGHYILMLEHVATDQTSVAFTGSEEINYSAQILRTDELELPRYAGMLVIGEIENGDFSTIGFGRDVVPVVRMHITDEATSVKPVLTPDNIIEVFPSPAEDYVNIKIDFTEQQSDVSLQLMDVSGKAIQQKQLNDVKSDQLQFDLQAFPVGSYFLNVNTPSGQRSVPFVIQR